MTSNSLKPLGYYQSDRRDEIMTTIALEFGDRLESLSLLQKREALIILNLAALCLSFEAAIDIYDSSVLPIAVPRKFYLLAEQLTGDGCLALSIALAHSLRDNPQ